MTDLGRGTTVNVGQIGGGIGANTISPNAFLVVDFRYTVPDEADRVVDRLGEIAGHAHVPGTVSRLSGRVQRPVMVESDATRDFVALVREASGGVIKAEQQGRRRGRQLHRRRRAFRPWTGSAPIGGKDHTVEEFMVTRSLFERIDLLGRVLLRLER